MNIVLAILDAVINSLWQAVAVAGLVWLALRFLPRINAATRYAIWWAALAVVLVLPVAPAVLHAKRSHPRTAAAAAPAAAGPALPAVPAAEPVIITVTPGRTAKWPLAVLVVWGAILLFRLGQIGRSYFYLRGVKRRAAVSPIPLPAAGRRADLLISRDVLSPMAVGFLRPAVILPESLLGELSEPEREYVLLHEMAHLAGYDDWSNLAMRILGGALALHPVAIWILRRIEREREMVCDDWVVARTSDARPYAATLARLFELRWARRSEVLASGLFGRGTRVGNRIERLLRRGQMFSPHVSGTRAVIGMAVLSALMFAGSLTPRWIAFAREPLAAFDVASVKPSRGAARSMRSTPRGIQYTGVTLMECIAEAYQVRYGQISGGQISREKYDIDARAPNEITKEQSRQMLQALLADRFKLRLHHETKVMPVYRLIAVNTEHSFRKSATDAAGSMARSGDGFQFRNMSMPLFSAILSGRLGRPVLDQTGVQGAFDFALSLDPAESPAGAESRSAANDWAFSSIFTDIQKQLGMKLEPDKGPVEYLVVDHVEKPDAN